ncbi:DUF2064 domain-containing protein [Endozoicomonas acroporae]|uniref:DUF2064 domain-containing protein n=1 Tax=Endozoicomonas acroporae TaxID=1701104 RepID=UPI003D7BD029
MQFRNCPGITSSFYSDWENAAARFPPPAARKSTSGSSFSGSGRREAGSVCRNVDVISGQLLNGRGYPALWTGEGDLGARLATISETLFDDYDGVVMIGSDSPQLCNERLVSAIAQIRHDPDLCLVGPAEDGGFYFFST